MTTPQGAERRRQPRFAVHVPVQLTVGTEIYPAMLCDLCRDACLVEVRHPQQLGSEVSLLVKLPGTGGPLLIGGRVVRVASRPDDGLFDAAVLFANLTPAAETRIDFFIALQAGG
jgi:PilZ domain